MRQKYGNFWGKKNIANRKLFIMDSFSFIFKFFFFRKKGDKMKHYIFKEVEKFKIQRYCKGCGGKIIVENANRYYCDRCRG